MYTKGKLISVASRYSPAVHPVQPWEDVGPSIEVLLIALHCANVVVKPGYICRGGRALEAGVEPGCLAAEKRGRRRRAAVPRGVPGRGG